MSLDGLKIFGLNIKDYFLDILLLFIWGLPSNIFVHWLYFSNLHKWLPEIDLSPLNFDAVKIAIWIVSFLVVKSTWNIIKDYLSAIFPARYSFNAGGDNSLNNEKLINDWDFEGNVTIDNGSLLVSNSNSGCLLKPNLKFLKTPRIWKDFSAEITFSFPKQQEQFNDYVGIIFRAINFEDYLMAEIALIGESLVFRPHLRLGGDWDGPILNLDKNKIKASESPIKLKMDVLNEHVKIYINDNYAFAWIIPSHVEPWMKQHAKKVGDGVTKTIIPDLYFRNRAGMFGFRCYGDQRVLIESLDIKGLDKFNLGSYLKKRLRIVNKLRKLSYDSRAK